jgi:hypothetical protein
MNSSLSNWEASHPLRGRFGSRPNATLVHRSHLKIANCMFGAEFGGLEQVFVDYAEALQARVKWTPVLGPAVKV